MHAWMLIGAIDVRSRDECRAAMTLASRPSGSILGQAWAGRFLQRLAIHLSYHTRACAHVYASTYVRALDDPALEGGWASLALSCLHFSRSMTFLTAQGCVGLLLSISFSSCALHFWLAPASRTLAPLPPILSLPAHRSSCPCLSQLHLPLLARIYCTPHTHIHVYACTLIGAIDVRSRD